MLNPSRDTEGRELHDFEGCRRHFETCGWPLADFDSASATVLGADDKLDALLARSQALKAAHGKANLMNRPLDPNWAASVRQAPTSGHEM